MFRNRSSTGTAAKKGRAENGSRVSEGLTHCQQRNVATADVQQPPSRDTTVDRCSSVRDDPTTVLCARMRSIFESDYGTRERVVNKTNEHNAREIRPLLNGILDNFDAAIGDENSEGHRQLVQYIIVTNYTGDPTSPICVQNASSALNTAIKQNDDDLSNARNRSPCFKRKQLKKITNLACGLQLLLYNTNRTVCNGDINDMIDTLPNAVDLLLQNINRELQTTIGQTTAITSWILRCYKMDSDSNAPLFVIRTRLASVRNDELVKDKMLLVFYIQYKKNLETIKEDLIKCEDKLPVMLNEYNARLKDARLYFKNTGDFDKSKLIDISSSWNEIIEMMNYLSVTINLILNMKRMANEVNEKIEHIKNSQQMSNFFPIVNEKQLKMVETCPFSPSCIWYPPSYKMKIGKPLFIDGYCIVMIVESNGTLISHDKNVGLIDYDDKLFGFSCIQAVIHFGTKPEYYMNCFYNMLKSQAHLLSFFHLHEQITNKSYVSDKVIPVMYKDAQVQTISNTNENSRCWQITKDRTGYMTADHKKWTRFVQTDDVYKSVQLQTGYRDVGSNTMKDKVTFTNKFEFIVGAVKFISRHYYTLADQVTLTVSLQPASMPLLYELSRIII